MWLWVFLLGAPLGPDARYAEVVRPLLTEAGCDAAPCHGRSPGPALYLRSASPEDLHDFKMIRDRIDPERPLESLLIRKALGENHQGGQNLDPSGCAVKRLAAWIGGQPDVACNLSKSDDFARTAWPALEVLGCRKCHQGGVFDLTTVDTARAAFRRFEPVSITPWLSPIIRAADGVDGVHTPIRRDGCWFPVLYGWLAGSPAGSCTARDPPDERALAEVVLPALGRRGCTDSSCHGGGAGNFALFPATSPEALRHARLVLAARGEAMLATPRNLEPHGGGKRLGGPGDCVDDVLSAWLRRQPIPPCTPPPPPDLASFTTVAWPLLQHLTCPTCHEGKVPLYVLKPPVDAAALAANHAETLKFVDRDFTPLSPILLRVREACAYGRLSAWIEGEVPPDCVPGPVDPGAFPRVDPHPEAP